MFHIISYNTYKDTNTNIKIKLRTLSWCQKVVRISRNRENLTVIESTTTTTTTNRSDTLSWCQNSGKSREEFTVIELTHANNNNNNKAGKFKEEFTHMHSISRGFSRGLCKYSDFFRDHKLRPQHIGDVRRDYIHFCGLELGLESSCFNPSQLRPIQELQNYKSFRATQSFRASNPELRTEVQKYKTP